MRRRSFLQGLGATVLAYFTWTPRAAATEREPILDKAGRSVWVVGIWPSPWRKVPPGYKLLLGGPRNSAYLSKTIYHPEDYFAKYPDDIRMAEMYDNALAGVNPWTARRLAAVRKAIKATANVR